jgi:hypothetical protein
MKAFSIGTFLWRFLSPIPLPAPVSSPGLTTQVRTTETKMDEELGTGRKALLKSHC